MTYELALDAYRGPLDKLLELVEEKKLAITEISLAAVTADFLAYLKKLEAEKIDQILLADFLAVASKLILIKSKFLLPSLVTEEDELEIRDLEIRLRLYQEIKQAMILVKRSWQPLPQIFSREYLAQIGPVFYPPREVTAETLHSVLVGLFADFEKIFRPVAVIKTEIINLKAKIEEVFKKLTDRPLEFQKLSNRHSKNELIVLFLAILHLIKEQLILVNQPTHFREMTIVRKAKTD
ncbi:MAG: Segregation and condensation protein A [Candidatus Jorgensenbacteria bacterium GW2011_GWA1_48_11]|uniref:Segregation and condensation protein A n=1 Tax=Candidatus Jorgensenbacteria bacterium GW2011_GWA1_48_11 TaxID=1618660 RepID=A0A0G1XAF8_9BACT|nr:MAG: Segregation and condensation protein A [Candidatus Jorgensenbacteria bacterium GW2011_GWA1_48_11]KKW12738.1 MAG: Segregation and condensation protein A [Candidatus Jorgensenbacteria bacterium GW2011_GWB1_49_9]